MDSGTGDSSDAHMFKGINKTEQAKEAAPDIRLIATPEPLVQMFWRQLNM